MNWSHFWVLIAQIVIAIFWLTLASEFAISRVASALRRGKAPKTVRIQ